ncbi:amidohydrolase family protein [Aliikangiella sp. G2MR2-5]|uniref:amidohydrolase family protein n=1 Tax=Aliikangiella sp. G2MR2-5 TaxID=2788943 RepID=UPI0018A9651C|nr:amidohydrolase family protein [Aliikangiella sp. G2MR2-5]
MIKTLAKTILLLSIIMFHCIPALQAKELLIKNITLISPERAEPLMSASVRIRDDTIIELSNSPLKASPESTIIDGSGKFLIPGLMDSHVHISNMPGLDFAQKDSPKMKRLQARFEERQPRNYLYFGVTQIVDLAQSSDAYARFMDFRIRPDIFRCQALPILHGYPTIFVDKDKRINEFKEFLYQPIQGEQAPLGVDLSKHTPEAQLKKIASSDAVCVKVFIENGFGADSSWPSINLDTLKRVREAANQYDLLMVAHANAIDMQQLAIEAGVDIIAHGMWNWNEQDGVDSLPAQIKNMAKEIIDKGITYQATFGVMDGLKGVTIPAGLEQPLIKKVVDRETLEWYASEEGQWFAREMIEGFEGLSKEKIHRRQDINIKQGEEIVRYLDKKDHPLVIASDTPSSPTFAQQPGLSTYQEILHMAKSGVSLKKILQAATLNNAKAFGLEKRYGTVLPGKKANLLILNQNPLETVEAYNSIDSVILGGENISRSALAINPQ